MPFAQPQTTTTMNIHLTNGLPQTNCQIIKIIAMSTYRLRYVLQSIYAAEHCVASCCLLQLYFDFYMTFCNFSCNKNMLPLSPLIPAIALCVALKK